MLGSLFVRLVSGLFFVSILPAVILFWDNVVSWQFLTTQIVSIAVSSIGIVSTIYISDRLSRFPSKYSLSSVLPIVFGVIVFIMVFLIVFRLPYSVYYLSFSSVLGLIFCFLSQFVLGLIQPYSVGYIFSERCAILFNSIDRIKWIDIGVSTNIEKLDAVVADFSEVINDDDKKKLADINLRGIPVYHVLTMNEFLTGRIPIKHLHENNLGSLLPSPAYSMIKQILDILIVLITIPMTLPICLFVALIIKIESFYTGGSIFFVQTRVGQGGKMFRMYKFRSMIPTSELSGAKMAQINDVRITRFGHFIRKTRLDELPQFINVLKGDMSLIGPRPEQPNFVEQFNNQIPFYCYRHIVKPGISGWAQVMQGYAGSEDETRIKLEYDFYYIKNFSFTLDVLIVIKTIQTMLTGFGAR